MAPFQNGVRQSRHPTNMATVAKTEMQSDDKGSHDPLGQVS
jgi:hypothetical protein